MQSCVSGPLQGHTAWQLQLHSPDPVNVMRDPGGSCLDHSAPAVLVEAVIAAPDYLADIQNRAHSTASAATAGEFRCATVPSSHNTCGATSPRYHLDMYPWPLHVLQCIDEV